MASQPKEPLILEARTAEELEDEFYKPRPQPYWHYDGSQWISASVSPSPSLLFTSYSDVNLQRIRLISWNIDILIPFVEERMSAALDYLEDLIISETPNNIPVLVYLQEMGQSDLKQIREARWIQERFFIADFDQKNWVSPFYGTQMLIDKRLRIHRVFRVPWYSGMDRDGLFVDIGISASPSTSQGGESKGKFLRLCNSHLESLVSDPPVRPLQLKAASKYLWEEDVAAALLAGDLNAIQPFDRTLHSENGLRDAYLELGGKEDSDEGYTWGYQSPWGARERFGCSRMDKILFRGDLRTKAFERIGIDVKVAEEKREEVREAGRLEWVTDHYGVMGDFELLGWKLDAA